MKLVVGFVLTMVFQLSPGLLVAWFFRKRKPVSIVLPLSIVIQFATTGIFTALVYRWVPYGAVFTSLILGVGFALAVICAALLPPISSPVSGKTLALLLLLSVFLSADNAWIYSKHGFSPLPGKTYFRPPLHDDMERHTIVTNALLRHSDSPLLANSPFLYQLSWHHMTALVCQYIGADFSRYQAVSGVSLATGILFSFIFLWGLLLLYPNLRERKGFWFVLLLMFTHTDIYHFICSSLFHGTPGIEADWSYANSSFIRFWSLKLILLTAPQHAAFFLLATGYFVVRYLTKEQPSQVQWVWGMSFLFPAFVYSPLMTGFLFLPYWGWKAVELLFPLRRKVAFLDLFIGLSAVILGYGVHLGIFGFPPEDLVRRPGTSDLLIFARSLGQWAHFPILPFATAGLLGLFLVFLLLQDKKLWRHPFLLPLFSGWFLTYLIVTDTEIRRHYSMIGVFLSAWIVARAFSQNRFSRKVIVAASILAVGAHGYYLYSYVGKKSIIDPNIAWADYFAMNRILATQYAGVPVVGAVDPKGIGSDYPIALEVTTSFSMPNHAVIHTRVTPEQFRILAKVMASGDVANYAQALGYKLILWGPVERAVWGERVERRFIAESKKIATSGEVSLFEIHDALRARLDREADLNSSEFYLKAAEAFANERWFQESLGYYFRAVELDPKNKPALAGLAHVLDLYDRHAEAEEYRRRMP